MHDATYACPDLTAFTRLDDLGLEVTGERYEPEQAVRACRVTAPDDSDRWCARCGCEGQVRDTVTGGWRTSRSGGGRPRWCSPCTATGAPGAGLFGAKTPAGLPTRGQAFAWRAAMALYAVVTGHLIIARVAEALAAAWDTANDAVLEEGKQVRMKVTGRFEGVRVIGVDEHVWRHTSRDGKGDTHVATLST